MPTKCKTWGCRVCRKNLLSYVKMKMEYGCLILEDSYLITLTLKSGPESSMRDAAFVRTAWERCIRSLKENPSWEKVAWFKIPELTKRGQPHLHLIVGGIGKRKAMCEKSPAFSDDWIQKRCECAAHMMGYAWYVETGAFVVDAQKVYAPRGAAAYMAKYLTKAFMVRGEMEKLGFHRRYATSRNWPRGEKIHLRGTDLGWDKVQFRKRTALSKRAMERRSKDDRGKGLLVRVGDDLSLLLGERNRRSADKMAIERLKRHGNESV